MRAPKHYGEERIFAFLREKETWIEKKIRERQSTGICLPTENVNGYELPLVGKKYTLLLLDTKKISVMEEERRICIPQTRAKEKLVAWIKENAKRIFTTVTEQKAKEMGVQYASVSVSSARSRWGCCTFNNEIRYSFRLLYAPKEIIEYVVVHELAHTKHKNHSKAFWTEVARYIPDWKTRRAWLKTNGALMQIF